MIQFFSVVQGVAIVSLAASGMGLACSSDTIPTTVHVGSLQLWLTADVGLACDTGPTPNRVTNWSDQSGKGHDATTPGQNLGPQCNVALHTLGGTNVPYFSNPREPAQAGFEYLNVDLSSLAGNPFTIFAVARAWTRTAYQSVEPLIGGPGMDVGPSWFSKDTVYVQTPFGASPVSCKYVYVMAWFDQTVGMRVWQNGQKLGEDTSITAMAPRASFTGASIGKGREGGDGQWFAGDIAEIIVYSAALNDTERQTIEAYLQKHWGL